MTTRAANMHLERGAMAALDEVQPSPTKAYMTISQVSRPAIDEHLCSSRHSGQVAGQDIG